MTMTSAQEGHVTIGIDLGDRVSHACVLDDPTGKVLDRMSFPTSAEGFERFRSMPPSRIVIEVGTHSPWVSRMLLAMGHEVIAANARRVGLIARSERKTDRVDAETLARLGRVDPQLLHPVRHRSAEAHSDLEVLKAPDVLVRCRTTCVNHVRGALKAAGVRPPASGAECFARKVAEHVPEALRPALAPLLAHLDGLTEQIRAYDRAVRKLYSSIASHTVTPTQITFLCESFSRVSNSSAPNTRFGGRAINVAHLTGPCRTQDRLAWAKDLITPRNPASPRSPGSSGRSSRRRFGSWPAKNGRGAPGGRSPQPRLRGSGRRTSGEGQCGVTLRSARKTGASSVAAAARTFLICLA